MAAALLGVPIALVSIIDADRQWFKSRYGLDAPETPREFSFCGHVVAAGAPLIVPDAWADARFADNPLVTGEPRVRFYAGAPLRTAEGFVLGTLCAIDHQARAMTPREVELLDRLASQVVAQLELRRQHRHLQAEREVNRRHRRFFELSLDLLCTADESLHFRELNPAWEAVLGWSLEELRAHPFTELLHPDDVERTLAEAGRLLRDSTVTVDFENRYRHKDGHWVPLSWVAAVDRGILFASARDMSAYQESAAALLRSQTELRASDQRRRALLEAMGEGLVVQDRTGLVTDCNPAAERILGVARAELLEHTSLDPRWHCVRSDGTPFPGSEHPAMLALRTQEAQANVVMGVPRESGELTWISINAFPLADEQDGHPTSAVVTFRDITAERAAQQEAKNAEARLRATIDTAMDAMITIDEAGLIERVNPAVEKLFGFGVEELVGQNVNILMPSPDHERHDAYLESYLRTGEQRVIGKGREVIARRKDGTTFPAELAVSEFELAGRRRFTGSLRDMTERKRVERLQADFVSTVSHELRTPLTSIRGSLGLIAAGAGGDLSGRLKSLVDIAYRNSERLSRLVDDILDIQKIEAGRMQFRLGRLDLVELAKQAIGANAAVAEERGVRLELAPADGIPAVVGDEDRLMQVITNLLSNAIKYSPDGGRVETRVELRGERVRVSVADQGPGVPADFSHRIFGKFQQADTTDTRLRGGTGLGLSIAKAITEHLGGSVGFDSAPGQGASFFFDLPAEELAPVAVPSGAGRARILVCEDDPDLGQLLRLILGEAGLDPVVAWNAAEARRRLAEEEFDGLTLDLLLPDQDGLELLRDLRADPRTANLPVVVVSARAEDGLARLEGAGLAVVDWLDKPIDQRRLLAALRCGLRESDRELSILHVEDDEDTRRVLGELMAGVGKVVHAADISGAQRLLAGQRFDLVVLDLGLPDGSGVALLVDIAELGALAPPVVIFSGREPSRDLANRVQAVLVKGHSSHEDIVSTLRRLVGGAPPTGGFEPTVAARRPA